MDFEMIMKEGLKGATLGAGSLASEFLGETISQSFDFQYADEATGILGGLGGVIALDKFAGYGKLTEYGSYFAYGLEANGFKKLYENFVESPQTSVQANKVRISADADASKSEVSAKQSV